jgi:hypothetical protein
MNKEISIQRSFIFPPKRVNETAKVNDRLLLISEMSGLLFVSFGSPLIHPFGAPLASGEQGATLPLSPRERVAEGRVRGGNKTMF